MCVIRLAMIRTKYGVLRSVVVILSSVPKLIDEYQGQPNGKADQRYNRHGEKMITSTKPAAEPVLVFGMIMVEICLNKRHISKTQSQTNGNCQQIYPAHFYAPS